MFLKEISESEETAILNMGIAQKQQLKFKMLLLLSSICFFFSVVISVFVYSNKSNEYQVSISKNKQLSESISGLKNELAIKTIPLEIVPDYFEYVIKRGDSFSKIAYLFYGIGSSRNSEIIANFNNMRISDLLLPGTKLKIKNNLK